MLHHIAFCENADEAVLLDGLLGQPQNLLSIKVCRGIDNAASIVSMSDH
jgi:hypothetical protein